MQSENGTCTLQACSFGLPGLGSQKGFWVTGAQEKGRADMCALVSLLARCQTGKGQQHLTTGRLSVCRTQHSLTRISQKIAHLDRTALHLAHTSVLSSKPATDTCLILITIDAQSTSVGELPNSTMHLCGTNSAPFFGPEVICTSPQHCLLYPTHSETAHACSHPPANAPVSLTCPRCCSLRCG